MDIKRAYSGATALVVALFLTLGGCALLRAPGQADSAEQRAAALETRVAALETRVIAQQSQLSGLQAGGARPGTPVAVAPTPAPVPTVAGLSVSGASKGLSTAKVTITEYSDFL